MFVQMFSGKVTDADAVRGVLEGWPSGAGLGAEGWLGTTAGVTDEGQLVAFARFESEQAARANSDRPEQGQWWTSLAANLEGDAAFVESSDIDEDFVGDADTAGFVQVMQGRVSNPQRARELAKQNSGLRSDWRPDILGSFTLGHGDGEFVMTVYFTSEAAAREGEAKPPPAEMVALMQEMGTLGYGEVTYHDLREPILQSPA